jgi:hypothetical protein
MEPNHRLVAILPCRNLDISQSFYGKLGFAAKSVYPNYRILSDAQGADLHLNAVDDGWTVPGGNPFGVYLYTKDIDQLAASLGDLVVQQPEHKPWGMYEFAVSDPDETLVRVGWPTNL